MDTTEQLKKLYSSQLASQKEQLKQNYMKADAEYAAEKEKAQKATDANLTRTAVEAQKSAVNTAELHNAYGLSSGARAQARLAQENQLLSNLTALRTQQQELDADVERQRSLLSQQYQSAIRQAQAENDLAKAEALYKEAQTQQSNLLAQQQAQDKYAYEAAKLMAEAGDYTLLANFYKNKGVNLTDADLQLLMGETTGSATQDRQEASDVSNVAGAALRQGAATQAADSGSAIPVGYKGVRKAAAAQTHSTAASALAALSGNTQLSLDQASIDALGFGPIAADTLNQLVEQGLVVEYVENGKIKFRRSDKSGGMPYSKGLMPLR